MPVLLPNAARAVVDIRKLHDYCLNQEHPRGRHKARMFAAKLALAASDADELRAVLVMGVQVQPAVEMARDQHGVRYLVEIPVVRGSRSAVIRSAWIVRIGEDFPRLTSCYVR